MILSICKEYKHQHNKTLQWTTQIYDKAEAIKSSMIGCMGDLEFDFLQRECSRGGKTHKTEFRSRCPSKTSKFSP